MDSILRIKVKKGKEKNKFGLHLLFDFIKSKYLKCIEYFKNKKSRFNMSNKITK